MRWLTVILLSLLLAVGVLPAAAGGADDPAADPSASPSVSPPEPALYPVFNYPQPGRPDASINNHLVRLLDQVPVQADVTAAFFVVQPNHPVVDALIDASTRGARVKVVLDSGDRQSAAINKAVDETFARLAAALGSDPATPSYAVQCVLSCISKAPESINHNKFVAMSATGDLTDVVFQSTANIRRDGSADGAWNAAVVSSGNPQVYGSYTGYAADLAARLTVPGNDYHAARPPTTSGNATPYFFPRTDGKDSVSQTLMNVNCSLAPTTVTVMASFFTRLKVRNRLNDMAAAGCGVRVVARTDTITREFCESLLPPVDVRISDKPSASTVGIHGKYLTVSGGFNGSPDARVVWVGSHNLTRNALVRNDETFLLVDDPGLHDEFVGNFDRIWADPSLTAGCGRAGGVSEEQIEEEADTEVTPLIKQQQTVARGLPKKLKRRTALKSTHTLEGQRLTSVARCRVKGTSQRLKKRKICRIVKPRSEPTLVLKPTNKQRRLKVRIVQSAPGSATLLPLRRFRDYAYKRPK